MYKLLKSVPTTKYRVINRQRDLYTNPPILREKNIICWGAKTNNQVSQRRMKLRRWLFSICRRLTVSEKIELVPTCASSTFPRGYAQPSSSSLPAPLLLMLEISHPELPQVHSETHSFQAIQHVVLSPPLKNLLCESLEG